MASLQKLTEGQTVDYINIESENQKSGLIILLVLFHSACPYKNYCLKCFTELQTLFIYLFIYLFKFFFFFYLVSNLHAHETINMHLNYLCGEKPLKYARQSDPFYPPAHTHHHGYHQIINYTAECFICVLNFNHKALFLKLYFFNTAQL